MDACDGRMYIPARRASTATPDHHLVRRWQMRNATLSMVLAIACTTPIVTLGQAQHGRILDEVRVSSVSELTNALGSSASSKIVLAAGTYELSSNMCSDSGGAALCINRAVTIEAEVPGSVVLDAKGSRRVLYIQSGGTAELIGLNITGGSATGVSTCILNFPRHILQRP